MTKTRPIKNPQDEPIGDLFLNRSAGPPDLRCEDEISLWPESPGVTPAFYCDDQPGPWALHLDPGFPEPVKSKVFLDKKWPSPRPSPGFYCDDERDLDPGGVCLSLGPENPNRPKDPNRIYCDPKEGPAA